MADVLVNETETNEAPVLGETSRYAEIQCGQGKHRTKIGYIQFTSPSPSTSYERLTKGASSSLF